MALLRAGGSAADAAIAASAVLAVTTQHMCGMGGDLFALVHDGAGAPAALAAVGPGRVGRRRRRAARRGPSHDAVLRRRARGDRARAASTAGSRCTSASGARRSPTCSRPPMAYARDGFPASPLLARSAPLVAGVDGADDYRDRRRPPRRRPRAAPARSPSLLRDRGDRRPRRVLRRRVRRRAPRARRRPVHRRRPRRAARRRGSSRCTSPRGATRCGRSRRRRRATSPWPPRGSPTASTSPTDPDDPAWAHLLAEAARQAGYDRPAVLHEHADGAALLHPDRLRPRRDAIDPDTRERGRRRRRAPATPSTSAPSTATAWACRSSSRTPPGGAATSSCPAPACSSTTAASASASRPATPPSWRPGRRPPHTLAPALVTRDGALHAVLGTMGGDTPAAGRAAAARPPAPRRPVTRHGRPLAAVGAGRRRLRRVGRSTTRRPRSSGTHRRRGRRASPTAATACERAPRGANVGHAHVIVRAPDGMLAGAADPRALSGAAIGW